MVSRVHVDAMYVGIVRFKLNDAASMCALCVCNIIHNALQACNQANTCISLCRGLLRL